MSLVESLFGYFIISFYLVVLLVFATLVYLMFCGPDLKKTDLNIMSDNQSPREMYELEDDNKNDENKDN